MDYAMFIRRGEETWDRAEQLAERAGGKLSGLTFEELESLAAYQRRVVSDFAYARTHFPASAAERRLRLLAFSVHRLLGRREEPFAPRVVGFFARGFRQRFQQSLGAMGAAVWLFVLGTVTGFLLTMMNGDFAQVFLGPVLVNGVRQGELWTDQISSLVPPEVLSSSILTNNISVALTAWAGGALFGLLSVYVLVFNGMMLGSVLALVWQYGLLSNLLDFIGAHGPLELTLIMVAGGAGLEMARGQLTSSNLPRSMTFARAARRSVRIVVGTVPWFVLLGIVEGFISPQHEIPSWAKAALGAMLLGGFLVYALAPVETTAEKSAENSAEEGS